MKRYHVNPETGEASVCRAKKDKCPFGAKNEHFGSQAKAVKHYEMLMQSETFNATSHKLTRLLDTEGEALQKHLQERLELTLPLAKSKPNKEKLTSIYSQGLCYQLALHLKEQDPSRYDVEFLSFGVKTTFNAKLESYDDYSAISHAYVFDKQEQKYFDIRGFHNSQKELIQADPELAENLDEIHEPEYWQPETLLGLVQEGNIYGGFHPSWREDASYALQAFNYRP